MRLIKDGAGDRIRTGDINLGKVALYQLSYSRIWRGWVHCSCDISILSETGSKVKFIGDSQS